jgi:hypothetical protein
MTDDQQRRQWRKALADKAKQQRNQRGKRGRYDGASGVVWRPQSEPEKRNSRRKR